jgi:hypothetical protein
MILSVLDCLQEEGVWNVNKDKIKKIGMSLKSVSSFFHTTDSVGLSSSNGIQTNAVFIAVYFTFGWIVSDGHWKTNK